MSADEVRSESPSTRSSKGFRTGIVLTLLASTLWGSTYPIIQLSLHYYDPYTISFFRSVLALVFVLSYFIIKKKGLLPRKKDIPHLLLVSVLGASGFWTLLNLSVRYLDADATSFLTALYPLLAVVLAAAFLHEKMNLYCSVGVVLGIFGTFVIVALGEKATFTGVSPVLGSVMAIGAAFSWAGYMIVTRYLVGRKDSFGKQADPEYVTYNTFLFAVPVTVALMFLTSGGKDLLISSPLAISYILYLGIVPSGIAFFIFNRGMRIIGVAAAAVNQLLFPAVAVILSYFMLGEIVNTLELAGMALIVIGIVTALAFSRR